LVYILGTEDFLFFLLLKNVIETTTNVTKPQLGA